MFGGLKILLYFCTKKRNNKIREVIMPMITTSQNTTLSIGQLHILEMMNRCRTEESLNQLKRLLFDYYSKEAVAEADRLWNAGVINESKIEEWGQEHMRTPYIHAK